MSVAAALAEGRARLAAVGVESPARDARLLLAEALGVEAGRLAIMGPDPVGETAAAAFAAMLDRRAAREPVAHILGRRLFWGRSFRVTADVLDPRPETEGLVAAALEAPFARLLDLGTGSGALAVTLLAERPEATGVATDLSVAALEVAAENAARHGVAARLALRRADWAEGIAGPFDLIVSNPPYLAEAEMAEVAPEVAREPRMALTLGGDGLAAYRAIAAAAPGLLAPGGRLLLEIGATQGAPVADILRAAGLDAVTVRPDLDGRDRVATAVRRPAEPPE